MVKLTDLLMKCIYSSVFFQSTSFSWKSLIDFKRRSLESAHSAISLRWSVDYIINISFKSN